MKLSSLEWGSIILLLLCGGLFVVAFHTNQVHQVAAIRFVQTDMEEALTREAERIETAVEREEARLFASFGPAGIAPDVASTSRLFHVQRPVAASFPLFTTFLAAGENFQRCLDAAKQGNLRQARQHWDSALRAIGTNGLADDAVASQPPRVVPAYPGVAPADWPIPADSDEAVAMVDAEIAALTGNAGRDHGALQHILFVAFENDDVRLPPAKQRAVEDVLRRRIPDFDAQQQAAHLLWNTVRRIEQLLKERAPPFRVALEDRILSVNARWQAALFPLPWERNKDASVRIDCAFARPAESNAALVRVVASVPGVWLWVDRASLAAKEQRVTAQYRLGQSLLAVILLMAVCVVVGLTLTMRRERELVRIRTAFLSTVSHDLRTPLALIRLYAETLQEKRVPEAKADQYFRTIVGETERLTGLVNNVVDFARIDRDALAVRLEPVDLTTLCGKVADMFQQRVTQEGFTLHRSFAAGVFAQADGMAVTQILFNLLDNALKYSADQRHIDITVERRDGQALISVADLGIGIPEAARKRVFEGFYRGSDPRVTSQRGSGIGLSVAKHLARRMNGGIAIRANEPAGTVMTLTLAAIDAPGEGAS